MSLSTTGGFKLNDLPVDLRLVYRIIRSRIHPIDSKDPITYEWALYLYAVWAHILINFGTLTMAIMKTIPYSKSVLLPFKALITQIVEHYDISIEGMIM